MPNEISTVQSLRAVDAWIDVINANISGGVRTAFKTARLKFAGANPNVDRAGTTTSLPLQFPEPSLITADTVIDFNQGGIASSTENTHLAIRGDSFFMLADPATIDGLTGLTVANAKARFLITRDGEFNTDQHGLLRASNGYYLVRQARGVNGANTVLNYDTGSEFGAVCAIRAIYNDLDNAITAASPQKSIALSSFLDFSTGFDLGGAGTTGQPPNILSRITAKQYLRYSTFGSTIFDIGFKATVDYTTGTPNINPLLGYDVGNNTTNTILTKSLESSNASLTQSVPELSLAQKLFSALTKILQTSATNTDSVINLIR